MTKTTDEKIDDLASAVQAGFESIQKQIDEKFDGVEAKFEGLGKRVEGLEKKVNNLPDKPYLDDKIADLKGDIVVKLRREDAKVNFLIGLLRNHSVLTDAEVERLRREFEIFPSIV